MPRILALACGLILVGTVAAGCGDGLQGAVRQESQQMLDNANPEILRIATVHDLGGNKEIVATLHGHFTFPPSHGCFRDCHPAPSPSYVWMSFSDPKGMTGLQATTASQVTALDNARAANPLFSIFPDPITSILCDIPRGNSSGTFAGSCHTSVDGYEHVTAIRFIEAWPFIPYPKGHGHQKHGGWIVTLDRNEHVRSIQHFGALPPQLWK